MEFYVYLNGAKRGPFSEERIQSCLAHGLLQPADLAADRSDGEWKPLSAYSHFSSSAPVLAVAAPREIAKPLPSGGAVSAPTEAAALPQPRSILSPNETPCYKTSLHWIIFARFAAAGLVLFFFAAIPFAVAVQAFTGSEIGWFVLPLPAFILVPPAVAFASSEIMVTDRRVLIKTGVLRRQTVEMFISKVESLGVAQSFLGRMFDYGTVRIRGTGGFQESFDSIARPVLFRDWVQRLQSGEAPPASEPAQPPPIAAWNS